MTESSRVFAVAALGLPEPELRALKSICALSSGRARRYRLCDPARGEHPDVYVVDADEPEAVIQWKAIRRRYEAPAILLTLATSSLLGPYVVGRPVLWSRMLTVLDEVTIRELKFTPALGTAAVDHSGQNSVFLEAARPSLCALVVDDSPTTRKHLELELKLFGGVEVICAETGERALEQLAQCAFDIVFLDVVLPGVDGYQVCKQIKKNPEVKRVPVVMLTHKSSPFDKIRGSLAGCDTYLTKPVDRSVFRDVVRKYLRLAGDLPVVGHPQVSPHEG